MFSEVYFNFLHLICGEPCWKFQCYLVFLLDASFSMHGVCLVNQMSIEPGVLKPVCLEIGPREHPTSLCFILLKFFFQDRKSVV